ncbi:MAG: lactate utilization protein B [Gammaproteobacteria bacterium]|nr:lactate utilization protein B [Gammaproteobacteria bacterium]
MQPRCHSFPENAARALDDVDLQSALGRTTAGFPKKRLEGIATLPEFELLRDQATRIREHVLDHLDWYLERFADRVQAQGGTVHWCADADEARAAVLRICREADARTVTKGKSMIGEEIAINDHLEAHGITPVETDLGEYIIQLRGEAPSHIVAPALHVSRPQVSAAFREHHADRDPGRPLETPRELLGEAREVLRDRFLAADVGITGANMLIAETGTSVIVTNEGNGDLTQTLPRVHVVLASIEKVVPTLEDTSTLLRVLARSITGQEQTAYTTFSTGPRRPEDPDGPDAYHVVLLDNGRSRLLGGPARSILRCIRCGACLGHCPVYAQVGGHAYGWVYSGPMGAALTPGLLGLPEAWHLPQASTLCGRCEAVCPVRIPIPEVLRHWRTESWRQGRPGGAQRLALKGWAWLARRPRAYRLVTRLAARALRRAAGAGGALRRLPGLGGWTATRDLPAPEGRTFLDQWRERNR